MWLSFTQVSQTYTEVRRCLQMNDQKGRRSRRSYSILRADASPRGVNRISLQRRGSRSFAGLAPHFGCSSSPRSFVPCSGAPKTSLSPLAQTNQNNRVSIGKTVVAVNSIRLCKTASRALVRGILTSGVAIAGGSARCSTRPRWSLFASRQRTGIGETPGTGAQGAPCTACADVIDSTRVV